MSYSTLVGPYTTILRKKDKDLYHAIVSMILPRIVTQINEQFDGTNEVNVSIDKLDKMAEYCLWEILHERGWAMVAHETEKEGYYLIIAPPRVM